MFRFPRAVSIPPAIPTRAGRTFPGGVLAKTASAEAFFDALNIANIPFAAADLVRESYYNYSDSASSVGIDTDPLEFLSKTGKSINNRALFKKSLGLLLGGSSEPIFKNIVMRNTEDLEREAGQRITLLRKDESILAKI